MAAATANHAQNKTAIIVGASRGLGLGLAREFARRGWQVSRPRRAMQQPRPSLPARRPPLAAGLRSRWWIRPA